MKSEKLFLFLFFFFLPSFSFHFVKISFSCIDVLMLVKFSLALRIKNHIVNHFFFLSGLWILSIIISCFNLIEFPIFNARRVGDFGKYNEAGF